MAGQGDGGTAPQEGQYARWQQQRRLLRQRFEGLLPRVGLGLAAEVRALPDRELASRYLTAVAVLLGQRGELAAGALVAPEVLAGAVAADEVNARAWERAERAARTPPAYLRRALGPFPPDTDPEGRDLWHSAAHGIERFRLLYGVTDPARPLGDPAAPLADAWQRLERDGHQHEIDRVHASLTTRRAQQARLLAALRPWLARHPRVGIAFAGGTLPRLAEQLDGALAQLRGTWPAALAASRFLERELARAWAEHLLDQVTAAGVLPQPAAGYQVLTGPERDMIVRLITSFGEGTPAVTEQLRARVRRSASSTLLDQLTRVDVLLRRAAGRRGAPERLLAGYKQQVAFAKAAAAELLRREALALDELLASGLPPYLAAAVGYPAVPDREERHRQALWEVEAFRREHGVTDPAHPLGPRPHDPQRAAAWDAAARRLTAAVGELAAGELAGSVDARVGPAALALGTRWDRLVSLLDAAGHGTPVREVLDHPRDGLLPPAWGEELERLELLPSVALDRELDRGLALLAGPPPPAAERGPAAEARRYDHDQQLRRAGMAARVLLERDAAALRAIAEAPPGFLRAAGLGTAPPARSSAWREWTRAMHVIWDYRLSFGVDHPTLPLGERPAEPAAGAAWDAVTAELEAISAQLARAPEPPLPDLRADPERDPPGELEL